MPPTTDICHHCHYAIPSDASICPGCGRRHGRVAPRLEDRPLQRSPLLREARWARRFLTATGWLGLGLALVAVARPAAGIHRLAVHLDDDAQLRLDHLGRLVACSTLLCLVGAGAAVALWIGRTRRNTVAMGLPLRASSPWSLPGWLLPGKTARTARAGVDRVWRDNSPLVGALPHRGWSRRLVSRVVLRWWSLWLWPPAVGVLVVLVGHADDGALAGARSAATVAAGALLVATARAFYDVIGIITVAHAHQGRTVARARADLPWVDQSLADEPDSPMAEVS